MHLHLILTKEFLTKEILENKKTITQVAVEVNCTKGIVISYCRKHNIYDEIVKNRHSPKLIDLTNKEFGKLTVVKLGPKTKQGATRWECLCSCGKTKLINATSLKSKLSKSCGQCQRNNFTGFKDISGAFIRHVQKHATDRGLKFEISAEDVWNQLVKQNFKCAISGVDVTFIKNQDKGKLQTASIDRIDSKQPYTKDNIQIVHKRLNKVKWELSMEELVSWAKLIYEKHAEKAIYTPEKLAQGGYFSLEHHSNKD